MHPPYIAFGARIPTLVAVHPCISERCIRKSESRLDWSQLFVGCVRERWHTYSGAWTWCPKPDSRSLTVGMADARPVLCARRSDGDRSSVSFGPARTHRARAVCGGDEMDELFLRPRSKWRTHLPAENNFKRHFVRYCWCCCTFLVVCDPVADTTLGPRGVGHTVCCTGWTRVGAPLSFWGFDWSQAYLEVVYALPTQ